MQVHDLFDNSQPEPGSFFALIGLPAHLPVALEYLRLLLLRNARPCVGNPDFHTFRLIAQLHQDPDRQPLGSSESKIQRKVKIFLLIYQLTFRTRKVSYKNWSKSYEKELTRNRLLVPDSDLKDYK